MPDFLYFFVEIFGKVAVVSCKNLFVYLRQTTKLLGLYVPETFDIRIKDIDIE